MQNYVVPYVLTTIGRDPFDALRVAVHQTSNFAKGQHKNTAMSFQDSRCGKIYKFDVLNMPFKDIESSHKLSPKISANAPKN